ncbi:Bcr/CflA family multidrug efflux MFS transporter [Sedimenticola selenatireducens]|uniref:Bcr/CflA family efflux transporter n=1 Tax=Sedimenticola selenatireducens TaxID=191960 RepID=A0A557S1E8_9GAMM|nr:Bcr/CflA family multidrug efflux MFS transporter [Sedimenticola selenatireducens]TVO71197.1 Bcr/CflA family multidrug efflux MFS transporter [Sedimenticola selenatireducens]TVT61499.1 MAG: Bcr/CflA family multidrug efflux MFS transporter [Sedimenticola selenatireducens]
MTSPKSLLATAIIASLVAIGPLSTDMYLPAFPVLMQSFNADINQVQHTLSIFLIGFALAQLIYGPLSDRFGRKPVLMGGLLLFLLSSVAIVFAESIATLSTLRLFQAIGGSAGPVLGRAMVRDIHGPKDSARLLSYISTAMAVAPAAAPILGGYLTVWFGWQSIFLFLAAYGVVGVMLLGMSIPETAPPGSHHIISVSNLIKNYTTLLKHRTWRWYTLSCSFVFAGLFSFLSGSSFVIIDFLGYKEEQYGLFFALVVAGFMIGTLIAGRLVRSIGINRLMGYGSLVAVTGGVTMAALAIAEVHHVAAIVVPQMIYMMGVGIVMPQSMAGALAPFPHMAGTASAFLGFIQMSFAAVIGVLVGHYHDGSPLSMALSIALMGILTLVSFLRLSRASSDEDDDDNEIGQTETV